MIIALGVLHAFVLLPVLLATVAPPTCGVHAEDDPPTIEMSDATAGGFGSAD
eukprot:COSAG03_NODE_204_length_10670_cov_4.777032_4_plen_52_part_00